MLSRGGKVDGRETLSNMSSGDQGVWLGHKGRADSTYLRLLTLL